MKVIEQAGRWAEPNDTGATYIEHLATGDLSIGTYSLRAGASDIQSPHTEDEVYVVQSGRATLVTTTGIADLGPGSVVFVPAGERHRFTEVSEDLALLVVFAPPYESRAAG